MAPKKSPLKFALIMVGVLAFWGAIMWGTFKSKPTDPPCYHDCYKTYDQMKADTANTGTAGRASTEAK